MRKKDLRIGLFTLIFTHIQVSLGLILYFVTPLFQSWSAMGAGVMKDAYLRKMLVEHPFGIVAVTLVTIGWSLHKKQKTDAARFKRYFYLLWNEACCLSWGYCLGKPGWLLSK